MGQGGEERGAEAQQRAATLQPVTWGRCLTWLLREGSARRGSPARSEGHELPRHTQGLPCPVLSSRKRPCAPCPGFLHPGGVAFLLPPEAPLLGQLHPLPEMAQARAKGWSELNLRPLDEHRTGCSAAVCCPGGRTGRGEAGEE